MTERQSVSLSFFIQIHKKSQEKIILWLDIKNYWQLSK